jgi:hypothetical protein
MRQGFTYNDPTNGYEELLSCEVFPYMLLESSVFRPYLSVLLHSRMVYSIPEKCNNVGL